MSLDLWLVRHGATGWTESGRLCGWSDVPLSHLGESQARSLRLRLAGERFDGVWASDLVRCADFATMAYGNVTVDSRLREMDFGSLEGRTWQECDAMTREALSRFDGFAAPGGETLDRLRTRVTGFLEELAPGRHLVFTHGGVIRLLTGDAGTPRFPTPGELTVMDWPARPLSGQAEGQRGR
jgi:probable phosphoglycerate mutase